MMLLLYFAAVLCIAILTPQHVNAGGVTSKLLIHIPKFLSRKDGYEHREALFGVPPYGGSIQQNVYYADSTLCSFADVDPRQGYPQLPDSDGTSNWPIPFILMVDRGDCTFVTKVRNAQRSGAAAVIVADAYCLCSRSNVCVPDGETQCESTEPVMADDGSGSDISIPSFLMYKEDADQVKEALKNNQMVRLEMAWTLPSAGDNVEYELWTTPADLVSRDFLHRFKQAAISLGPRAVFKPNMYIYDGIRNGCQTLDGENQCYTLCTNQGRYCATDPDGDLDTGISGADVVTESLRRICIWNKYGTDGIGKPWWDYVEEFMNQCDSEKLFSSNDCVEDAMKRAQVDFHVVAKCVADSGGLEDDGINSLLEAQIVEKISTGVVIVPTMYVNKTPIRGALSFATVFKAICAGYADGHSPEVCEVCATCPDDISCVVSNGVCISENSGQSASMLLSILLVVIGLFAGLGVWHYMRTRQELREQVRSILAEYVPLEDNEDGAGPMDFARRGAATSLIS